MPMKNNAMPAMKNLRFSSLTNQNGIPCRFTTCALQPVSFKKALSENNRSQTHQTAACHRPSNRWTQAAAPFQCTIHKPLRLSAPDINRNDAEYPVRPFQLQAAPLLLPQGYACNLTFNKNLFCPNRSNNERVSRHLKLALAERKPKLLAGKMYDTAMVLNI